MGVRLRGSPRSLSTAALCRDSALGLPGIEDVRVLARLAQQVVAVDQQHVDFDLMGTLGPSVEYRVSDNVGHRKFHSRYMIFDGTYKGERERIVWMGTPNLTGHALRESFETLLKIRDRDDETFRAFSDNFESFWSDNDMTRAPTAAGHWPDLT